MKKSENYYRRKELLMKLEVPMMSEVTKELGKYLSKVVFQECPEALKEDLGLKPKLKGPGANLWVSPSDLLIGKVCLKPPLTDKHIKALTHEGIIAIGNDIELKFWNEMELEKKKALDEQAEYLTTIAEKVQRVAIKMARNEERVECERRFEEFSKEFEERLKFELDKLEQEMLEHQQNLVKVAVAAVEEEWKIKLEEAVQETVQNLTREYLQNLEKQKGELEKTFRMEFEKQSSQYTYAITREHEACDTTMKQLRHCLECKNLANLMYVLCMERRKCCIERSLLEYKHKTKIDDLYKTIEEKDNIITRLTAERDRKQAQLDVREACVLEILKQFQKFINYALRATPTQAEFLLNVKKMMLFEITQTMVKGGKDKAKNLANIILPWQSDSESSSISSERSKLTLPDYHECLNEVIPPEAQSDFLPAFYYNDKLYVNKDLYVMAGKGMDISETNVLWNRDVENFMKILRTSVSDKTAGQEITEKKSVDSCQVSEQEISNQLINHTSRSFEQTSRKSTLKGSTEKIDQPLIYCTVSASRDPKPTESKEISEFLKKVIKASLDVEIAPIETTGLLATKDSLVKIRESRRSSMRSSTLAIQEVLTGNTLMAVKESLEASVEEESKSVTGSVNFENLDAIRIPDQLEIKKPSKSSKVSIHKTLKTSTPKTPTPKTSTGLIRDILQPVPAHVNTSRESRLLSTKDSLIIHRKSLPQTDDQIPFFNFTNARRASTVSKLSMAKDSLELIRSSKVRSATGFETNSLGECKTEGDALGGHDSINAKVSALATTPITHIELAKIPTVVAETSVNFSPIQEVYEDNLLKTSDSPWKIYECEEKLPSRDNFLTKPNQVKITGEPQSKEHIHGQTSFTVNRINSIMNILKEDPSLMRLFTSCTK